MNQLAFPGAGSILAGRRLGYVQAAMMLAGFVLVMTFLLCYIAAVFHLLSNPNSAEEQLKSEYQPWIWAGQWGSVLCVVAWVWALASSVTILRQARREPPAVPPELSGT